jgi:hypothetical protein
MNRRLLSWLDADLAINGATLAAALVIAEQLYKFRSFTLEALAFLATWYVLATVTRFVFRRL